MTSPLVVDALALSSAPDPLRQVVEACAATASFAFGDELTAEGTETTALRLIVSGQARASVRGPDGDDLALARLGPGSVVGAEAAFGAVAEVTVRASGPVETVTLDASVARGVAAVWAPSATALRAAVLRRPGPRHARVAAGTVTEDVAEAAPVDPPPPAPAAPPEAAAADWSAFRTRSRRRCPRCSASTRWTAARPH